MSTEHNEPQDIVSDGVEDGTRPVPREEPADRSSGRHAASGPADGGPAGSGGTRPPGPAEEQNSETADDRGLTTEPSSSD
ncbi:hypothetical protein JOE40_002479 [Arthrobacter sp. PvP102]|jgi:hypothetical protein|uniref:hypothetical protein n=1 Tax=unclassified Arthrobacter TaxID=235627 RepID=UPI00005266F6|nr:MULTISPECIES: hypothetical protein [unclassified Arthrobacter]ABK04862.1 hypothetical protein Arth_3487 [Arthrobacter sp. FB24]MBP1232835.1 hypothetical protein [Arthrobacter sp. PvP103]MBP1237970.1 hypothetical protein [Arthrobacter sp. PvP102]